MSWSMIALIFAAIVLGGLLLMGWMAGAFLLRLGRFLFGFGRGGAFSTLVRAAILVALLLWAGRAMSMRRQAAELAGVERMLREAAGVAAAEHHPLHRSCSTFRALAERERKVLAAYRRDLAKRLGRGAGGDERRLLEGEAKAVDDWMAWLDAAEELPRAISSAVDADTAHAAAARSGRVEYLDAASRLELESEKARRRAVLVLERLAARWSNRGGEGVDIVRSSAGPLPGGEVESP